MAAAAIYFGQMIYEPLVLPFFARHCKETGDEVLRVLKVKKAAEKSFTGIYFFTITVIGFTILRQTDFLIPALGGKSSNTFEDIFNDYPFFM